MSKLQDELAKLDAAVKAEVVKDEPIVLAFVKAHPTAVIWVLNRPRSDGVSK